MKRVRILSAVCSLSLGGVFSAVGQTTFATITGRITDSSGGAVSGASVVATHIESNYTYDTVSNATGSYTISQLREGDYSLKISAAGFKSYVAQRLKLVSLDIRRLDVKLEVGSVETRVEVTAGATLIETETARISDNKDALQLKTLPLNTRSLWNFVGLSPGVVQAGGGSSTRRFAGSRANQSDASIDGITLSNQYDGTQISPLVSQIESFQEVRVDMANNTAEFGSIGQVTIISKGGSNQLHGAAFDYYSTPWFRARDPFALQRGTGVRHNPGASVGGPVYLPRVYDGRNRTFFYYSFETTRGSQILSNLTPTVPTAPWRSGDFSRENADIRDPFAGAAPFAGRIIPASRINPVSKKIQDRFYPQPNFGDASVFTSRNFRTQLLRPFDPNTYWTTRIDHRFSDRHFVFGRYIWNRSHSRDYDSALPSIGTRWQTRDTRAIQASYTATLRSNLMNEFRWGYAWNDNPRNGPLLGLEVVKDLGLTGLLSDLPDINGVYTVSFSNLGLTGISQTPWRHPGFKNYAQQFQEHLSWYRGRHSLKFGMIAGRTQFQDQNMPTALFGSSSFSNRFTGQSYADFLLGIPTSSSRAAPVFFTDRVRWNWDFFATEEWKARSNLTLNLGVRYELHPAWSEASGRQAVFDIASGKIVVPDGALNRVSPLLPAGYVGVIEASGAGYDATRILKNDYNNLAPRIGLAWRPWGPNTVVRAGFGIFYDIVPRAVSAGGAPFVINEPGFTNPTPVPTLMLPQVFPSSVAGPTSISLPTAYRADLRDPYSMQYNLTVEHQRWNTGFRISYIGTNTRQGEWGYNYNQPVPDNRPYVDKPRPFPKYPAFSYVSNGAGHQYHSLTMEAERHYANGLAYQLSWVWARDIGDLERGESPENAFDRQRERAVWLDIPTHRVTGNLIYQFPFGKGRRGFARAVMQGWEWSSVFSFYSGQFLTPQWTGPDPVGTAFTNSRTPAQVTIRPNQLRSPNLPADERSTGRWFDPSAFAAPVPGSYGSSAKGVIKGPGTQILDVGLAKEFPIQERFRLRLEITGTNFFNTPNYDVPNTTITSAATVATITSIGGGAGLDATGARGFRAGVRLEW
ncbi:MAG TPA: carboxypeptidase-like regulatory domain-containing protein [Bryobacteraceae bacterium]|nr:carboxypeptidase-like regulatory domain-containing protein [Bryobacteraceae bacterium]